MRLLLCGPYPPHKNRCALRMRHELSEMGKCPAPNLREGQTESPTRAFARSRLNIVIFFGRGIYG
ncbi:UNVERIFIED_CONTAM: hypothetical protein NCL1_47984 [Trichonephila clavipes]